jgi:hypothetical protein
MFSSQTVRIFYRFPYFQKSDRKWNRTNTFDFKIPQTQEHSTDDVIEDLICHQRAHKYPAS